MGLRNSHTVEHNGERVAPDPTEAHCLRQRATGSFNFYRDVFGRWRWEYRDSAGQMHDSQHCYESQDDCVADAKRGGL